MSADGCRILGVEALIRWNHPTRGLLLPDEFIGIAEGLHLIVPIGQWVLESALAQVLRWQRAGWADARVSVNLSNNQFRAASFVKRVLWALEQSHLPGRCLELELTERMLMDDDVHVTNALDALRSNGVSLAIDDFGTGHSSLSRLRSLPIEKLKIDRSFIVDLPGSPSSLAIVKSILELARGLSLTAIAGGVETTDQQICLSTLGCEAMQGFLFSRPMPRDEFLAWLIQMRTAEIAFFGYSL